MNHFLFLDEYPENNTNPRRVESNPVLDTRFTAQPLSIQRSSVRRSFIPALRKKSKEPNLGIYQNKSYEKHPTDNYEPGGRKFYLKRNKRMTGVENRNFRSLSLIFKESVAISFRVVTTGTSKLCPFSLILQFFAQRHPGLYKLGLNLCLFILLKTKNRKI